MNKNDILKMHKSDSRHGDERKIEIQSITNQITLIVLVASLGCLLIISIPNAIQNGTFSNIDSLILLLFITLFSKSIGLYCYYKKKSDLTFSIISIIAIILCLISMFMY